MRLSLKLACLLGFMLAVPAIDAVVTAPAADARAGGSYGSSGSHSSGSSRSYSSSSYSRSRSSSRSRSYGSGTTGNPILDGIGIFLFIGVVGLAVIGGFIQFIQDAARAVGFDPGDAETPKRDRLAELMPEAARRDPVWEEANLLAQVHEHYLAVQRAWVKRDQRVAKDVMTPELYAKHKAQTDEMISRGEVNLLQDLEILSTRIVHLADRADDSQDEVWVRISARAIDCLMNEHTGQVLKGDEHFTSLFTEVWKFKRDGATWRAAEIAPAEIHVPASFAEAV